MKIGVLGGTFDPVHAGHLVLAEQGREQLKLDQVLWVPAREPWRKADTAVSPAEHRLEMVRLAIAGNDAFAVSTAELEREGPSFTVDMLRHLRAEHSGAELVFLLGIDALFDLPHWHEPAELISLATLGVALRGEERLPPAPALDRLLRGLSERVLFVQMPRLDISGSDLRRRAAEGLSLRYLVPPEVDLYIRKHGPYRST